MMRGTIDWFERHGVLAPLLIWLVIAIILVLTDLGEIYALKLGDTDDNLRMAQVRALLDGQGWYDLRQYRMMPPEGADIHWSRLPDLPIAGLILALTPFLGRGMAEAWAAGLAPLMPLAIVFVSVALVTRRLVAPAAGPLAIVAIFFSSLLINMFTPLRIDHHGWQLAFLSLAALGITDPRSARGGAILGLASAASLAVGLEMIIYLALFGGATVLGWVFFTGDRRRLAAYALSLAGGTSLGFLLFASEVNRAAVCDALSPVWLADAAVAGALLLGLAWIAPQGWRKRLGWAVGGGVVLAAFHALAFPHCLSRLEGVSDEATALWLSKVREAKPIFDHGIATMVKMLSVVIVGLAGYALLIRKAWKARDMHALRPLLALALPAIGALALTFWQTRTGAAAQLLAAPGAAAFVWILAPLAWNSSHAAVRVLGTSLAVILGSGALPILIGEYLPSNSNKTPEERVAAAKVNRAACSTRAALAPLAELPRGMVFTFIDMAPRVIVITDHDSVTGPYHRNDDAIVFVLQTLKAPPEEARVAMESVGADYLLICKGQIGVIGKGSDDEPGLTARLDSGEAFEWLEAVEQPEDSPNLLYRLRGPESSQPAR